jgi:hypothetical protein
MGRTIIAIVFSVSLACAGCTNSEVQTEVKTEPAHIGLHMQDSKGKVNYDFHAGDTSSSQHHWSKIKNGVSREVDVIGDAQFESNWPVSGTKGTTITLSERQNGKFKTAQFKEKNGQFVLWIDNGKSKASDNDLEWAKTFLHDFDFNSHE